MNKSTTTNATLLEFQLANYNIVKESSQVIMYDVYYSITALTTVIDVLCKIVHNKFGEIQRITVVITELLLKIIIKGIQNDEND